MIRSAVLHGVMLAYLLGFAALPALSEHMEQIHPDFTLSDTAGDNDVGCDGGEVPNQQSLHCACCSNVIYQHYQVSPGLFDSGLSLEFARAPPHIQ